MKYAVLTLAAMLVIAGVLIAYLAATFDPRQYEPRIVDLVREKTGRTLAISGGIELSFWPDVGVRLGMLSLSERGSAETFAEVDAVRLRLEVLPLVSGRFVANEIVIRGAHVRIVRDKEGRLNIDDLLGREGEPVAFDIGRVAIENSALTLSDLSSGARYELTGISLASGRLANGVPTSVALALSASDAQSTWKVTADLKTRLVFDLAQQRFAFEHAALEVRGYVPGMSDLISQLNGDAIFQASVGELRATQVSAVLKARVGEERIEATLVTPNVLAVPGQASADKLVLSVRAEGPAGTTRAHLMLPQVRRDADVFSSDAVTLELELGRGETTVQAGIASALDGRIAAPRLALKNLKAKVDIHGLRLPGKLVSGALEGDAALDLEKQGVRVHLRGRVAESHVEAVLTAAGFAAPVYTFVVDVDEVDLDRYAAKGPVAGGRTEPAPKRGSSPDQQLFAPLAGLPASGSIHIGVLKADNVKARNVKLILK